MSPPLTETTRRHLDRLAIQAQRRSRTPALATAVARDGELLWHAGVGQADLKDPSVPLGPDTQFLIASNTKTFTAAMVMQLRDAGRLRLEDPVDRHLPVAAHGVSIRQLLSHTGGIQREPVGEMWEPGGHPEPADPLANFAAAEAVLAPGRLWHYSNLAYMLLGQLVGHLDGRSWEESLRARLLEPLGLRRTTTVRRPPYAGLYYVPEFSDVPIEEPVVFTGSTLAAGGLASTLDDLVRWHAFLLDPDDAVLSADSVEEMRTPQMTVDPGWQQAYGLGLQLIRRGERIFFGHTGGAPGGISGAFSHAASKTTGIVLTNQTGAREPGSTAVGFADHVIEHDPAPETAWRPGPEVPAELSGLLGVWFSEGVPGFFSVREGQLEMRGPRDAESAEPVRFRREAADVYRTLSGTERGERLLVRRREDGSVWQLNWATYRWTRAPLGFGEPNPDRPAASAGS